MAPDVDDRETAVVAPVGPPPPDLSAEYERVVRRADRVLAWRSFGTIGFDAYLAWVLDNGTVG